MASKALLVWTFLSCLIRVYPYALRKTPASKNDGDTYTTNGPLLDIPYTLSRECILCETSQGCCVQLHRLRTAQLQALPSL